VALLLDNLAVLHVALNPVTGPWSVMRDLAQAQAAGRDYRAVGIGVIAAKNWPEKYAEELSATGIRAYRANTVQTFGTAQFILQHFSRPPVNRWVDNMLEHSGADRCVVHFHNAWMSGVFMPIGKVRRGGVGVVATFHGVNAQLNGRPVRHWLHRWMAARLPRYGVRLTSVDTANLGLAESLLRLDPKLFKVIPNGVADMPDVRCSEWDGKGEFRAGHVGSITERKGWRLAADAVLQLRAEGLKIRLLIAGSGPEEDQANALAKENPGIIEFLGHVKDPRCNLLPRLHALTIMSAHEGLPMTLIEAMSVGLPVVATGVGGIPEAITDGKTGLLVPRESKALAEAIRTLHKSPGKCRRLGIASREEFQRRFELRHIVEEYDAVYRGAFAS
jgi:glycosyltransferase involved in cell wall biosynthesis